MNAVEVQAWLRARGARMRVDIDPDGYEAVVYRMNVSDGTFSSLGLTIMQDPVRAETIDEAVRLAMLAFDAPRIA